MFVALSMLSNQRLARFASLCLLCVAFVWVSVQYITAQESERTLAGSIDRLVQQQIKRYSIPGLSIAVASKREIVFSRAYGEADLENGVRVTERTLFRIGSI